MKQVPQFDLKQLSQDAIPEALQKAIRYRLLNEPAEAESICLDVLAVDSQNQEALVLLLLALTDRFSKGYGVSEIQVQEVVQRLASGYDRSYYGGIIAERRAKAQLHQATPGSGFNAYEGFREAMELYDRAERIRPPGNDDALLRWNTCARIIMRNHLRPRPRETYEPALE